MKNRTTSLRQKLGAWHRSRRLWRRRYPHRRLLPWSMRGRGEPTGGHCRAGVACLRAQRLHSRDGEHDLEGRGIEGHGKNDPGPTLRWSGRPDCVGHGTAGTELVIHIAIR